MTNLAQNFYQELFSLRWNAFAMSTDSLPTIDQFRRQSSGVRKRLGLEVDQEIPEHFAILPGALDKREHELADELISNVPVIATPPREHQDRGDQGQQHIARNSSSRAETGGPHNPPDARPPDRGKHPHEETEDGSQSADENLINCHL
ncbi:hypothetical protein NKJ35_15290 [Mesorhizobium sp. M0136]|uniref:hypothetical protein n=1 Tax=Mesorhizobium sp. M0136 TaxID=2956890 RepID=UPI003334DE05